jgi:hypothetical protein
MQKVEQCRSNCREQLNIKIFASLSTSFSCLKIARLIKRIGITDQDAYRKVQPDLKLMNLREKLASNKAMSAIALLQVKGGH